MVKIQRRTMQMHRTPRWRFDSMLSTTGAASVICDVRHVSVRTIPQSPEQLLEELFAIFPHYRARYAGPIHDHTPTYHSVLMAFTPFFGERSASFSERQLRTFGELVNTAVAAGGSLENAFGTCLLEHLHQIRASKILRPYLSELARERTHA
jgi:hypothetical protein